MLIAVFTWFTTSIGKTVAKLVSFVAVAIAVYWRIYASGEAAERARQVANNMNAQREREKLHDQISKLPDAAVRDELRKWVRNDR
ncbi:MULTISPECIES: hypothetical protein [Rhizobium]|uniref:hypothetical protein n=1 Tax=Rhizobium TaxID=379 RepID=UPI0004076763|nr:MULTISPECIES: hypothetical protein [Rhizobium]UFS81575.1 hypothetical protein LPB79_25215 [Rhizobium sp. T136]